MDRLEADILALVGRAEVPVSARDIARQLGAFLPEVQTALRSLVRRSQVVRVHRPDGVLRYEVARRKPVRQGQQGSEAVQKAILDALREWGGLLWVRLLNRLLDRDFALHRIAYAQKQLQAAGKVQAGGSRRYRWLRLATVEPPAGAPRFQLAEQPDPVLSALQRACDIADEAMKQPSTETLQRLRQQASAALAAYVGNEPCQP